MRYAVCLLLLAGCALNVPVSQFDEGVAEMCKGGLQEWQGETIEVNISGSRDELYTYCGPNAQACSKGDTMWVIEGPRCPESVAHELNHIVGNDWVDNRQ